MRSATSSAYKASAPRAESAISMTAAPKMASTMLTAMLLMTFAFWAYAFAVVFMRARAIAIERESDHDWVMALTLNQQNSK